MTILVIDAQGGGLGKQLITGIRKEIPGAEVLAVGTNATATAAMVKAGATRVATGENAVRVACEQADIITGPIGICIADSMLGEITADIAAYIGASRAVRVLIPYNNCNTIVAGVDEKSASNLIKDAVAKIARIAGSH